VAIAGAALGGLFASGVLPPSSNSQFAQYVVTVLPDAPARLKSANGNVVVDVAPGTVSAPSRMEIRSLSPPETPVLPAEFRSTGKAFDLTTDVPLLKPITIMVQVSEAEVAFAGGDGANIVIQHYRDGAWTPLATAFDFGTSMATAQVDALSIFALTIRAPTPTTFLTPNLTAIPPEIPTDKSTLRPIPTATAVQAPTRTPARFAATLTPSSSARIAYSESKALSSAGEYEKAIEKLNEAIRLDSLYAAAYSSRGFAYLHTGQNQQAIQDYDEAIRLAPERVDLYNDYFNRGFVYNAIGQHQRAVEDYNEAIRLNPGQGWLYDARAMVYDNLGEDQKAKADRDTACLLDRTYCKVTPLPAPTAIPTPAPAPTPTPTVAATAPPTRAPTPTA